MDKLTTILLNSLHQDQSRLDISELKKLSNEEWTELIALASKQRVRSLLYQNIKDRGLGEIIPAKETHALKAFYTHNTIRNLRYLSELKRIVSACTEKNIPVIALKGIYLANTVYENIGLREMNDIDLLVTEKCLAETADIMVELGYESLKPFSLEWKPMFNHLPRFVKAGTAEVEIHWTITTPEMSPKFDIYDFWEQAESIEIANTNTLSLSPNDTLLYLCFHNAKHSFAFGLRPYYDIKVTIQHFLFELNWDKILERAKKWGWKRNVYLSLRLAKEFVGAKVPEHVLGALTPEEESKMFYEIAKHQTFANKILVSKINPYLAVYTQSSIWGKITLFLHHFFQSKLEIANRYHVNPNSLTVFLKYPLRWKNMYSKYLDNTGTQRKDNTIAKLAISKGKLLHWLSKSN